MKVNRKIIFALVIMSILFLSLMVYLTYFTLFQADDVADNEYNRRFWAYEEDVLRGKIVDRNGTVLAESDFVDGEQVRYYPYKDLYCHIIGYNSQVYGRTQLELKYNDYLLGKSRLSDVMGIPSIQNEGYTLELTIDHDVQQAASRALNGRKGAVVAMNPKTGEVLAMVSNPGFDPNEASLIANWNALADDEDAPFLARAVSGLYAPGSTFKIITSAASFENDLDDMKYEDEGEIEIDGMTISNYDGHVYGDLDLKKAFAVSANTYFAELGRLLGTDTLKEKAEDFGFNKAINFELETGKSLFPDGNMTDMDNAQLAIGQHQITATPLQMLLVASAIANEGEIVQPYLVKKNNDFASKITTKRALSKYLAAKIGTMMENTVKEGTATAAAIGGYTVAGKTGTAENESGDKDHAWFVGYAGLDQPEIAVAVILEFSGSSGGEAAAPVAKAVMQTWLNK